MLILTNIGKDLEFEISKVNGRMFLNTNFETIGYKGVETNVPCTYYVVESSEGVIDMSGATEAKMITFETVYETGVSHAESNVDDLILTFGSKKNISIMKKRHIDGIRNKNFGAKFIGKTQILPPVNEDAKNVGEYFLLENMFPSNVLESFSKIDMASVELHSDLKKLRQSKEHKIHFLLADCMIKLLERKYITNDCLNDSVYRSFFEVIEDEIEVRRLTALCRDKLIVLCYILILEIEGFSVSYGALPDFKLPSEKVINMFKSIGCSVSPSGDVFKLVGKPKHVLVRS